MLVSKAFHNSCILLEKVLDVVGSSMDTWKTG